MTPSSVLPFHTAPLIMSSFTKKKNTNDNVGFGAAGFGQFQRIFVGTFDKTIRVPVDLLMRETPYRKALVVQHFFRKIKHLATNNTFSHGDLISIVASRFDFETGIAETESEATALLVHRVIFSVNNLEGVGFTNNTNNFFLVDPSKPALEVMYFMLRYIVNGFVVDKYVSDNSLFLEFAFRLLQTPVPSITCLVTPAIMMATPITPTSIQVNTYTPVKTSTPTDIES